MNVYDILIESGVVFLVVYAPLYWGGVTPGAVALIEIVTALLLLVWILKHLRSTPSLSLFFEFPQSQRSVSTLIMYSAMGMFMLLAAFQLLPLPALLIKILAPSMYRLYVESAETLNMPVSAWLPLSVYGSATKHELLRMLVYPTIFFLTVMTFRTRRQVNRLVYIVLAMGFLQAASAFSGFISRPAALQRSFWISGNFVNKNHFAGYMEMVILLGLGMFLVHLEIRSSSRVMRPLELMKERYPKILLWLIGLLILVCAHLLSGSRGGWLSLSFGIGCFGVLVFIRRLLRRWVALLLIVLPLAAVGVIMLNPTMLVPRMETLLDLESQSQVRRELWKTGLAIFHDFPVTGTGLGTFSHINQRYRTFRSTKHFEYAHNDYIQLLSETGLVGIIVVSLVLINFWFHALTAWRQHRSRWTVSMGTGVLCALISLLVHSTTDFNLHIPSNALLFTVLAALGIGMWNIREEKSRRRRHKHATPQPSALPASPESSPTITSWGLRIAGICVVGWYLFQIVTGYSAFRNHERFLQRSRKPPAQAALLFEERDPSVEFLERAIRSDPKNAAYAYALGSYLHQYVPEIAHPYAEKIRHERLQAAQTWVQSASMLAPTNAWYYYELGRLSFQFGSCEKSTASESRSILSSKASLNEGEPCPTVRYFTAALQNAPHDAFLQETVGRWLYTYEPEMAFAMIEPLVTQEVELVRDTADRSAQFSKFLYDIRLDYASDRQKPRPSSSSTLDDAGALLARLPNILNNSAGIELGNDDGTAEWRTRLYDDTLRVSKVIAVPQQLDAYTAAAVRIYMNNGGSADFVAYISLDNHLLKTYAYAVPREPGWQEIPVDLALLYGKSFITVYVRTSGASRNENYLQIWGDNNTPTTHSVFNFDTTNDLSFDNGVQTGEYLIRLVLRSN